MQHDMMSRLEEQDGKRIQHVKDESCRDWFYFNLEIAPDPVILQDEIKFAQYEHIDIDLITWSTLLMISLNKMYGLIGESSPFETQVKVSSKSIILKIQPEDREKFSNSLLSYTFNLNKYTDMDLNCCIKIKKRGYSVGKVI